MNRMMTTSALAVGLLAVACAQDGTDTAAYEADQEAIAAADEMEQGEAATASGEQYGSVDPGASTDDPYSGEYAETGTIPDPYEDQSGGSDPIGDELAGLDGGMDAAPLSEDEVIFQARDAFAMADMDGDGSLSREEYLATMTPAGDQNAVPMGEGDATFEEDEMATAGETAAAEPTASEFLIAKFESVAGSDEIVTLEELEESAREDFTEADSDGDEVLTGAETAAYAALREGRSAEGDL